MNFKLVLAIGALVALKATGHDLPPRAGNWTMVMKDLPFTADEEYYCQTFDARENMYIVGVEGNYLEKHLHHLNIYGCTDPPFMPGEPSWDCTRLDKPTTNKPQAPNCITEPDYVLSTEQVFGWDTGMPPRAGVKIGTVTGVDFIVIEAHYLPSNTTKKHPSGDYPLEDIVVNIRHLPFDDPYVKINANPVTLEKELFKGVIPAHSIAEMDVICRVPSNEIPCDAYAFGFHLHHTARHASVWRIHHDEWALIGENRDLLKLDMTKLNETVTIHPGDIMASRCVYKNEDDVDVMMGHRELLDEMCMAFVVCISNNLEHVYNFDHCLSPTNLTWNDVVDVPKEIAKYASAL